MASDRNRAGTADQDGYSAGDSGAPEAESVAAAARRAGVSRTFLYERIASGELPTIKLGKRRLVRVGALRGWLERLERKPAA
jgi:excisionase family DNA binding protein